jgi:hypothetical protein
MISFMARDKEGTARASPRYRHGGMESATLTRPGPGARGPVSRVLARVPPPDVLARVVFVLLCVGFAIGFFVFPTYPNYDSYYSLLWGREVLDLQAPTFEGFRIPTEHPLAIAAGALLSLLGEGGDRVWVFMTLAAYLALVAGVYRLGRVSFTPLVGAIAAGLLLTRFDYAFLAARGYIDIPYMALVIWAAVLEAQRPRRGTAVLLLLSAAGLLRPEGWLLAALYWVWVAWPASWKRRAGYAALAAIGPVVWALTDWAVTGDPLFSLHYTSSSAEDLGRQRSLSELPSAIPLFFSALVKLPVLTASMLGFAVALLAAPRRTVMPAVVLVTGLGTFVLIGIAGASVIERYLAVAALALLVFAAVAFGGWEMLERGTRLRRLWMGVAVGLLVFGIAFTATRISLARFDYELSFRGTAHDDLTELLRDPKVQAGLRCGPLTLPNHKLVPDSRWIADLPHEKVIARADPHAGRIEKGIGIYVTSRFALFKHAITNENDSALVQVPPAGFERIKVTSVYSAYVAC